MDKTMNNKNQVLLTEDILDSFISILTIYTGIVPRASHRDGIKQFIENKIQLNKYSVDEYRKLLIQDKALISEFVNQSTVNETYFFREEKQFDVIKEKLLPMWKLSHSVQEIKIWSAACSYGEEAYSLAVLALSCGVTPKIIATDINSEVLLHCQSGVFL